jgi:hypothetical protein
MERDHLKVQGIDENNKMDVQEVGWGEMDLIAVAQDRNSW